VKLNNIHLLLAHVYSVMIIVATKASQEDRLLNNIVLNLIHLIKRIDININILEN
jgi:hypothetical protein